MDKKQKEYAIIGGTIIGVFVVGGITYYLMTRKPKEEEKKEEKKEQPPEQPAPETKTLSVTIDSTANPMPDLTLAVGGKTITMGGSDKSKSASVQLPPGSYTFSLLHGTSPIIMMSCEGGQCAWITSVPADVTNDKSISVHYVSG